jgi:hypothetical protein
VEVFDADLQACIIDNVQRSIAPTIPVRRPEHSLSQFSERPLHKPMKIMRLAGIALLLSGPLAAASPALPGYVVHFDFISSVREARELVGIAALAGAKVVNIVPPAHVWESELALAMLDAILDEVKDHDLSFLFTRIDASLPPDKSGNRFNYLYGRILTDRGRLPTGGSTLPYFLTTVGQDGYAEWMEEETRYYAARFGRHPRLLGINLGPFSEPFSSQRGGFLQYMRTTGRYEITQYTPPARKLWHRWLAGHFNRIEDLNREYGARFRSFDAVPMPLSETDACFTRAQVAYYDFVRSLNDWFVERYQSCRRIWHDAGGPSNIPLILQFSGGVAEKLAKGRPSYSAFDLPGWVAMADAVALSIYTNSGFRDMGHGSIRATINLAAVALDLQRSVYVLEGGTDGLPQRVEEPGLTRRNAAGPRSSG